MPSERLQRLLDPARQLQLALAHSRLGDWTWDAETDVVEFSPRGMEIFGLDPGQEVTWESLRTRLHPDDRERARLAVEASIATASDYDIEYRVAARQEFRWVSAKGRAVYDADGAVLGMIGVVQDISDRKRTEERLRESEERFRVMADDAPVMIWVTESDGTCTYLNRPWCEFTGMSAQEGYGLGWLSAVHPDDREAAEGAFLAANERREPFRAEYRLRRHDGAWRWALDAAVPRFGAGGTFLGYIGSVLDISERKEHEDALRAGEELFRTLVHAIPQLVWTCTPDGRCDFVSRQWLDYSGADLDQLLGYGWLSFIHPDDQKSTIEAWEAAVANHGVYDVEGRIRGANGLYRWFRTRAVCLRDERGQVTRWIGTNTDVHDLKHSESELRKANEDLSQFAYSASHDLQEPLRNLTIFSQLFKRRRGGELSQKALDLVDVIESSGHRMSNLVHDLLVYTQAGAGEAPAATALDANQALDDVLRSLHSAIDAEGAVITSEPLPALAVHPAHLQLIFINLLSNALKYRRPELPPEIHISAKRSGLHWVITVADNGIGIGGEYHHRVFGLFKRLHGRKYPGTGLGLAICKKIVERYGGRIWVESEAGSGARFHFRLPGSEESQEKKG